MNRKAVLILSTLLLFSAACDDRIVEKLPPEGKTLQILGTRIPSMKLHAFYKGKISKINLENYRGQWLILFFYPGDFTFVCPTELKELAEYYKEFKSMGAEVISISTDSVFVHRAWHRQNESVKTVTFPMASDRNGKLSRAMGIYNKKEGSSERGTFIINPVGEVTAFEVHNESIGRSADELLRKLSAAIAVQGGTGYCPAGWKQGDKMIHPK